LSDVDAATYLLFASGALTAYTGRWLWLAYSSRTWPRAIGHVVVANADIGVLDPHASSGNPGPAVATWAATFVYRYNVRGNQRIGTRLRFTPISFREARRAAAKYQPGHGVRVAVHPSKPELSVLETGPTVFGIAAFVGSSALTIVGAVWLIVSLL
jgi:hypothetical protein